MATIYDTQTGDTITAGLQGSDHCDEAILAARRIAADRGRAVLLADDDGDWIVSPNGGATPSPRAATSVAALEAARRAGWAWAEREAEALVDETRHLLDEPWGAMALDALPLVPSWVEGDCRAMYADVITRAAAARWRELAAARLMREED